MRESCFHKHYYKDEMVKNAHMYITVLIPGTLHFKSGKGVGRCEEHKKKYIVNAKILQVNNVTGYTFR